MRAPWALGAALTVRRWLCAFVERLPDGTAVDWPGTRASLAQAFLSGGGAELRLVDEDRALWAAVAAETSPAFLLTRDGAFRVELDRSGAGSARSGR